MTKFPTLFEKQVYKELLATENIENDVEENSNNPSEYSNTLPVLSEKHVQKDSLEIEDIENYMEEHLDDTSTNSNAFPILSKKQVDKESLESGKNENCFNESSNYMYQKQREKHSGTLKIKSMSNEDIYNCTKNESPSIVENNAENSTRSYEKGHSSKTKKPNTKKELNEKKLCKTLYACKYCNKTFRQSKSLKVHEKIHTDENEVKILKQSQ